jgi:hypothetical protein
VRTCENVVVRLLLAEDGPANVRHRAAQVSPRRGIAVEAAATGPEADDLAGAGQ